MAGIPSREDIYQALFAKVAALGPQGTKLFKTVTREVQEVQRWNLGEQPVLMQYEMDEDWIWNDPPNTQKKFMCWFIIGAKTVKGQPGGPALNALLEPVEAAIRAPIGQQFQTLGGTVFACRPLRVIKNIGDNSTEPQRQASASMEIELIIPAR